MFLSMSVTSTAPRFSISSFEITILFTPISEYKMQEDAPIRYMAAKRPFGSWARMQSMLKVNFPDQWAKANKEDVPAPAPKAEKKTASKPAKAAPKKAEK